ncbi:MAG: hypothetical protein R2850_13780 [Bacteroidia bacterium]
MTGDLFRHTITAACIESGRKISVLHHFTQPADHPTCKYLSPEEGLKKTGFAGTLIHDANVHRLQADYTASIANHSWRCSEAVIMATDAFFMARVDEVSLAAVGLAGLFSRRFTYSD